MGRCPCPTRGGSRAGEAGKSAPWEQVEREQRRVAVAVGDGVVEGAEEVGHHLLIAALLEEVPEQLVRRFDSLAAELLDARFPEPGHLREVARQVCELDRAVVGSEPTVP